MKRLSHEDIIEGSLFGKTIAEAKELLTVVNQLIAEIKENGIQTKKTMDTMEGGAVKNTEQLRTLTSAYYQMTKAEELHTKLLTEQGTLQAKIANLEEQATANIVAQNHALKERAKALQDEVTGINAAKAAQQQLNEQRKQEAEWAKSAVSIDTRPYERLRMQLAYVKKELKDLVVTGKDNTATAKALREEYERLNRTIRTAEESVGEFQRSVGQYSKAGFRQFHYELFQVQQILRELPNFAISSRIGFMALSNNLPQLSDAFTTLSRKIDENTGKQIGNLGALKMMVRQIFSFQSALLMFITLTVAFSDQIGKWVQGIFGLNNATEEAIKKQREFDAIGKNNLDNYAKERAEIQLLLTIAKSENTTKQEKYDAIKRLNEISPEYLGFITAENVGTQAATLAIQRYIEHIEKLARAKAMLEKYSELEKQILDLETMAVHSGVRSEVRAIIGDKEADFIEERLQVFGGTANPQYNREYIRMVNEAKARLIEQKRNSQQQLMNYGISEGFLGSLGEATSGKGKAGRANAAEKSSDLSRQLGQDLAKARIEAMVDGYEKEVAKILAEYAKRKEDLADKYEGLKGDPRFSLLMGELDNERNQRLATLKAKHEKELKDANDKEIQRQMELNEKTYQESIKHIKNMEDARITEAEAAANELMKKATTAEQQKQIEEDLQQSILQIKIKSLEDQIRITELAASMGMVSIDQLNEQKAALKLLKSEMGLENIKDPTKGDFNRQRQQIKAAIDGFNVIFEAQERRQQNRLDKQIEATRRRQQELRDLANLGQRDAQQSLAAEERRLAELERKKEALQKRAARRQIATTALQAASNRLQAGDQNAIVNTINDMSRLMAAIYALPTFYDGTENVDKSISMFDLKTRKDPYVVRLHPGERVMTAKQNEMIGDMSNSELAQLAFRYRSGFSMVPVFTPGTDTSAQSTLVRKLDDVKRAIEQRPESVTRWNEQEKAIEQKIVAGNKVRTIINKTGGVWRS